jgi:VWFA-related protein
MAADTALPAPSYLSSDEITSKQQGRKALIILTDGVDSGSKTSLSSAIEAAQRADTVVYSVLFADKDSNRGQDRDQRPNGKNVLQQLSSETGGRMFEVSKNLTIDQIYAQIQEELRSQYSLGYTPEKTDDATGYRKIQVTSNRKNMTIQARDGYYATP